MRLDFLGQRDQAVGLAGHGRRHDHQLVPVAPSSLRDAPGDVLDALGRADRGAAVLLDDQCHDAEKRFGLKRRNFTASQQIFSSYLPSSCSAGATASPVGLSLSGSTRPMRAR